MKLNAKLILLSLVTILFGLSSCLEDSCSETRVFIQTEPIYVLPAEFRIAPTFEAERELINPGKIYYYEDMLMINEKREGIHIYNNSNPSAPTKIGFLAIPGNLDVSIKNNLLYADNYVDLITIDISDIENPQFKSRNEETFLGYQWVGEQGYLAYYQETEITEPVDCSDPNFGEETFWRGNEWFWAEDSNIGNTGGVPTAGGGPETVGNGGSLAKFSLIDDYLYVLNAIELIAYSLANPMAPRETATTIVSWGAIETLFPYKNYLFIGANNGMYIYDRTNPASPEYVSEFIHATACDPVFVKDDIAYVTLRDGTACQNFINQLDVIDVSNIEEPKLLISYKMENPHGLSVTDDKLYLCEGTHGLKVFENEKLLEISDNRIEHVKDIHAVDIIALSNIHMLVVGDDGLYQYDSSDPSDLSQMSFIPVSK